TRFSRDWSSDVCSSDLGHVWLHETAQKLDEVLVSTGYETISKERVTGSFDFIENSLLERQIAPDIISKLEGLSPAILFDKRNGRSEERRVGKEGRTRVA